MPHAKVHPNKFSILDLEARVEARIANQLANELANQHAIESSTHALIIGFAKNRIISALSAANPIHASSCYSATAMTMSTACYCCGQSLTLLEMHELDRGNDTASCESCEFDRITNALEWKFAAADDYAIDRQEAM